MTCGKPSETLGSCEEGVSTCVLLAEKLDAIAGAPPYLLTAACLSECQ